MADGPFDPETGELIPRDPSVEDLVSLCRELHAQGAKFMVVGGFSIRAAGYGRRAGREKDRGDIEFLRQYFAAKGIQPSAP